MFQSGSVSENINGTRFVSKDGEILQAYEVREPLPVKVDGTLQLIPASDPILMAALVIVDKGALNAEQVTGRILSVNSDYIYLDPDMDTVCGVTTDNLRVNYLKSSRF
jgi:hypothetical protein